MDFLNKILEMPAGEEVSTMDQETITARIRYTLNAQQFRKIFHTARPRGRKSFCRLEEGLAVTS
jgi:hypothetical protein